MIPIIEKMEVYPVAGKDCMELNLSGAHAPYFTRNIVVLTDSTGATGVGEVPGGQKITKALEESISIVEGTRISEFRSTMLKVKAMLDAKGEVDVRGMSAEEALFEVDNFLSRAIMAGLPSVTVIHGKGTGVLRTAVQQHLRKNKRVKSVRSGVYGEGEQGVTIVELR